MTCLEVRKEATIKKRLIMYHTQDTTRESNKNTINIANKSQEVSPFSAGDHKAAMNRRKSMRTQYTRNTKIHLRSTALERSVKIFYWRA